VWGSPTRFLHTHMACLSPLQPLLCPDPASPEGATCASLLSGPRMSREGETLQCVQKGR
jgi:hypothetical protein